MTAAHEATRQAARDLPRRWLRAARDDWDGLLLSLALVAVFYVTHQGPGHPIAAWLVIGIEYQRLAQKARSLKPPYVLGVDITRTSTDPLSTCVVTGPGGVILFNGKETPHVHG